MRRAIVVALLCVAWSAAAQTPADKKTGNRVWREGVTEYDLGKFDAAIAKFEEAYKLNPNPNILFNLAQAHRKKKSYEPAIFYFKAYLRNKPQASNRGEVEKAVQELEGMLAAQQKETDRPPQGVQEPPPPAAEPAPQPLPPAALAAAPGRVDRPWYSDRVGLALAGGGLIAAGVGVGLLVHAGGVADDADATLDQLAARDLHDKADRLQLAGGILVGVGAAAVTGGVIKMLLGRRGDGEAPRVSVGVGPRGFSFLTRY